MTGFLETSVSVGSNSVKAFLFRIPAVLFNVFVYRIFGVIAMKYHSFTANILFREDYIQRFIFILEFFQNRKIPKKQAVLVFAFTVFAFISSLYDQVLWAAESPGYIYVDKVKTASDAAVSAQLESLKATDHTVLLMNSQIGNTESFNLEAQLSTGLFKQGFNASLLAIPTDKIQSFNTSFPQTKDSSSDPFPILHLADNLSISFYNDPTVTSPSALKTIQSLHSSCNLQSSSFSTSSLCLNSLTPSEVTEKYTRDLPVRPHLYFRHPTSPLLIPSSPGYEIPSAKLSPWTSLATGSNSIMGKELLTIGHGPSRSLLSLDYWQVALRSLDNKPLPEADIRALLERTQCFGSAGLDTAVKNVLDAQDELASMVYTELTRPDDYTLATTTVEYMYLNATAASEGLTQGGAAWTDADTAHILRCQTAELSLLMVDEFDTAAALVANMVDADGKKIEMTCPLAEGQETEKLILLSAGGGDYKNGTAECVEMIDFETDLKSGRMSKTKAEKVSGLLATVDVTAGLVLSGFLGGRAGEETTETSLGASAVEWYNANLESLNGLLLARALMAGLDRPDLVRVSVRVIEAGLSYLQILLVCFPVLLLVGVKAWNWKLARTEGTGSRHYGSSLLQNLYTTTEAHASSEEKFKAEHDVGGGRGGYLWGMEEIVLRKGRNGQYVMGTRDGGVFRLCYDDGREREDGGEKDPEKEEGEKDWETNVLVKEFFDGFLMD
ncbi:hypothetical protein BJ508DRAFT_362924 [Ascobolus immersus RN42]|uniref:Uncharacterized protein n=1 Tax=Ascobolus immersus RN42 TaxID=1160509 RepID=A0A3N4I198_ASCIM|nr:hypothetical protein BJ508DRAFT_362924 [Ascobolus immersus RN42]